MRIGIPANYFFDDVDGEMSAAVLAVVATLEAHGAKACSVQIPDAEMYGRVATAIARPEATAAHAAALRAADSGLGAIARARLREGAKTTAEAYLQAVRLRRRLLRKFVDLIFDRVDVVITPVIPEPAPPYAAATAGDVSEVIARMGRFSRFTRPFNLLGLPTLSLPCGFSRDGRPLACQVVGRPFDEATVLRLGQAYERHTTWHASMPPVHAPAAKHLLGGLRSA
jgi:Asp-tRNA(Asn)/Glu-tRNA(Gln) amidotransferase A subunit family amidase